MLEIAALRTTEGFGRVTIAPLACVRDAISHLYPVSNKATQLVTKKPGEPSEPYVFIIPTRNAYGNRPACDNRGRRSGAVSTPAGGRGLPTRSSPPHGSPPD